ncbi:MAG TPA: hypothetical protein VKX41_15190 [Alloacidobacterium sp.]|nr:hypothetical protein [Alloacidobacterium sp.]
MDEAVLEEKIDALRDDLRREVGEKYDILRRELDDKHTQNRKDIHDLRNGQQNMQDRVLLKVEAINTMLQDMRIKQAESTGLREMVSSLAQKVDALTSGQSRQGGVWEFLKVIVPWLIAAGAMLWKHS